MPPRQILHLLLPALLLLAACQRTPENPTNWWATWSLPADFLKALLPPGETVASVVPATAPIHEFQPTPMQTVALLKAPFLVSMGLGLEPWLPASGGDGKEVHLVLSGTDGAVAGKDPHIWLDPTRVEAMIPPLADALCRKAPHLEKDIRLRATNYLQDLRRLDGWAMSRLTPLDRRKKILTGHGALGAFAGRYGILIESLHGRSTADAVAAGDYRRVVERVRQGQLAAWLPEAGEPDPVGEALCRETGLPILPVVWLESLSPRDGPCPTYLALMTNLVVAVEKGLSRAQ